MTTPTAPKPTLLARIRNSWKAIITVGTGALSTATEALPLIPEPAKHYVAGAIALVGGAAAYIKRNRDLFKDLADQAHDVWTDAELAAAQTLGDDEAGKHEAAEA